MTPSALLDALVSLRRARIDPVWFAEEKLRLSGDKFYLDEWQKELLESVADVYRAKIGQPTKVNKGGKNQITIRAMHGPGKTFGTAAIMHWFNYCFEGRIVCTAPKEKQLHTRLWPAFRRILNRASDDYKASTNILVEKTQITWGGNPDRCAVAETASQPENLAGYHDDYLLFLVDEASGVSEEMFPVIEGAISTGTLVILILIGNPTKNQGTFYDSHCRPKVAQHYHQIHVDLTKTTRVNREWVTRLEDKYGRNSPVVKVRCYGEFADTEEAQLLSLAWLTEALEREAQSDGTRPRLRITVDVADGGADESIITVARIGDYNVEVVEQRAFSFPSSEAPVLTAEEAAKAFDEYGGSAANGDDIVVDSLGVGAGTAGTLIKMGYPVVTYKGGEGSDDDSQWRNRRTQSYMCFRDAARDGTIAFGEKMAEDWDDFAAQCCSIKTVPGTERLEELETKKSMTRRGVKSPDRADGVAMIYATQAPHQPVLLGVAAVGDMESAKNDW